MAGKSISLEIDSKKIKIGIIGTGKNPALYQALSCEAPYGTVDDGYIIDRVRLTEIVRKVMTENQIKLKHMAVTVNSTKIASREVVIPFVKDDRIKDVIYANASEYFPFSVDEYCLAYEIVEKVIKPEERKIRLMVYAAPDKLIQSYYDLAASLGLKIDHIDYFGNSCVQLLGGLMPAKTNFIMQISEENTLVTILSEGKLRLQRTIPYGVRELKEAVLSSMGYDAATYEKAEEILKLEDIMDIGEEENEAYSEAAASLDYSSPEAQKHMFRVDLSSRADGIMRYLYDGVTRVMDYFLSGNTGTTVDSVYMGGVGASYKTVQQYFKTRSSYEIKPLASLFSPKLLKTVDADILNEYLPGTGALLSPLDFIPLALHQPKAHTNRALYVILIFSVAASAIMVGSSFMVYMITNADKNRVTERIEELSDVETVYNQYMSALSDYQSASGMMDATRHNSQFLGKVITELEEKLPSGVILEGFSENESGLSFSVTASSKEEAARTLLQLRTIPYFSSIETSGITHSAGEEGQSGVVTFSVQAVYFENLHGELSDSEGVLPESTGDAGSAANGEETTEGETATLSPEEEISKEFESTSEGAAE